MTIATSRRGPGHSPSSGPDSSATSSGVANMIETVSASCRYFSAKKFSAVEPSSSSERTHLQLEPAASAGCRDG